MNPLSQNESISYIFHITLLNNKHLHFDVILNTVTSLYSFSFLMILVINESTKTSLASFTQEKMGYRS